MRLTPTASPGASGRVARGASPRPPAAPSGANPPALNARPTKSATSDSNPPSASGVAMGRSSAPVAALTPSDPATTSTSAGVLAKAGISTVRAMASTRLLGVTGSVSAARVAAGRGASRAVASIISSIGVMPAIVSLVNIPSGYRDGTDQLPVDVDGAAAHPGDHTRVGQRAAFEACKDQVAPGTDHVLEHADDADCELVDAVALEHGPAGADHPRADLVDREQCRRGAQARQAERRECGAEDQATKGHRSGGRPHVPAIS